jgi:hypothetical protein
MPSARVLLVLYGYSFVVAAFVSNALPPKRTQQLQRLSSTSCRCPESVFGREHESEKVYELLEQEPSLVQVILGPCSSGKTKLLRDIATQERSASNSCIAYLDGRSDNFYAPGGLVAALAWRQRKLLALLPEIQWDAALQASKRPHRACSCSLRHLNNC